MTRVGTKPVGSDPFIVNGVTMLRSWEMLLGVQALWKNGVLLGVFHIGEAVPGVVADTITLHPQDYEFAKKCHMERRAVERSRRFHEGRNRLPWDAEQRIARKLRETQRIIKGE